MRLDGSSLRWKAAVSSGGAARFEAPLRQPGFVAVTIQIAAPSGTVSPRAWTAKALRMSAVAAARTASLWPSSIRLVGPIVIAARTAVSRPRPAAMSSSRSCGSRAMSAKPASLRTRRTRASLAKANGPGSSGLVSGRGGACLRRFAQRQDEERVLLRLAPAGEDKPPAGFEAPAQVGERLRRIGEEHDAEPRHDKVRGVGGHVVDRGVGECERDRQVLRRSLAGARQHRRRNIEAQDRAGWADALRELDRRRAAAAADVDHAVAGLRIRHGDQPVGNRAEHLILVLLVLGPLLTGVRVPIVGLRGIVGVDRRSGHGVSSLGRQDAGSSDRVFGRMQ